MVGPRVRELGHWGCGSCHDVLPYHRLKSNGDNWPWMQPLKWWARTNLSSLSQALYSNGKLTSIHVNLHSDHRESFSEEEWHLFGNSALSWEYRCHSNLWVYSRSIGQGEGFKGRNEEDRVRYLEQQSLATGWTTRVAPMWGPTVVGQMSSQNYFLGKTVVASAQGCGSDWILCDRHCHKRLLCMGTLISQPPALFAYLFC